MVGLLVLVALFILVVYLMCRGRPKTGMIALMLVTLKLQLYIVNNSIHLSQTPLEESSRILVNNFVMLYSLYFTCFLATRVMEDGK